MQQDITYYILFLQLLHCQPNKIRVERLLSIFNYRIWYYSSLTIFEKYWVRLCYVPASVPGSGGQTMHEMLPCTREMHCVLFLQVVTLIFLRLMPAGQGLHRKHDGREKVWPRGIWSQPVAQVNISHFTERMLSIQESQQFYSWRKVDFITLILYFSIKHSLHTQFYIM